MTSWSECKIIGIPSCRWWELPNESVKDKFITGVEKEQLNGKIGGGNTIEGGFYNSPEEQE